MAERDRHPVLVVDDEPMIRALVGRYLQDEKIDLKVVGSGAEALEAAEDMPRLALLITDVLMPEMEGPEVARRLRQRDPDLKVLYLTGFADRLFDAKQQLWELEAFLEKPFTRDSLRQAVAQLLFGRLRL